MKISICVPVLLLVGMARPALAQEFYPQETESYLLNYMVRAKDPTAATVLSLAPGFGAGHFYCDDSVTGAIMAAGNAVGLLVMILGPLIDREGGTTSGVLMAAGGTILFGFRFADAYLAPFAAAQYNGRLAKKLKIKSLVMRAPGDPQGSHRRLAFGMGIEGPLGD